MILYSHQDMTFNYSRDVKSKWLESKQNRNSDHPKTKVGPEATSALWPRPFGACCNVKTRPSLFSELSTQCLLPWVASQPASVALLSWANLVFNTLLLALWCFDQLLSFPESFFKASKASCMFQIILQLEFFLCLGFIIYLSKTIYFKFVKKRELWPTNFLTNSYVLGAW